MHGTETWTLNMKQDWFDDNEAAISNLLAEKNLLHKAYAEHPTDEHRAAFYRSRCHLQQRLREMQDVCTSRKAEEIEWYAERNGWKYFFSVIKAVYGRPSKGTATLLSADGSTLLTEKTQILQRWPNISKASSTAPPPSPTPPSSVCRNWRPTWTSTSRHLSRKPSAEVSGDAYPPVLYLRRPDGSLRYG
ncbi:hypothetical protein SprV_1002860500 [Sparganum proliferum]